MNEKVFVPLFLFYFIFTFLFLFLYSLFKFFVFLTCLEHFKSFIYVHVDDDDDDDDFFLNSKNKIVFPTCFIIVRK